MPPKTPKTELEQRILTVQDWLLDDWPTHTILAQIKALYLVQDRQARHYLNLALSRWQQQHNASLAEKRALKIEGLKKLKQSLRADYTGTPMGIRTLVAIDKEIIKLEGLAPPSPKKKGGLTPHDSGDTSAADGEAGAEKKFIQWGDRMIEV